MIFTLAKLAEEENILIGSLTDPIKVEVLKRIIMIAHSWQIEGGGTLGLV